jgi:phosphate-selective porin OprO/OprP
MKVHPARLRTALLAGAALAAVSGGFAEARESNDERIARLEAALTALQGELRDLKAATAVATAARTELPAAPVTPVAPPAPASATVSLKNARPTLTSADGQFTASLRGIFELDGGIYDQDDAGPLATDFRRGSFGDAVENDRARDMADGFNFRRIRFGIEGKAFGDFQYSFVYDFGGSANEEGGKVNAAWVQYNGLVFARLRVGAFPTPTGLEDGGSYTTMLFAERPAVAEVVRGLAGADARVGAALYSGGERWTLSGTVTGNIAGVQTYDEQLGFVGRATFVPYKQNDTLIHLGLAANVIVNPAATGPDVPGGAPSPIRLRERPELRVDSARLVDTGSIDADGVTALGLEFGAQHGSLYLQAEYFDIAVERRASALPDPDFSGWYLEGSWLLTGERRVYNTATAGFDGPKVAKAFSAKDGNWGAWELGLRYSILDLNYRENDLPALGSIRGGEQAILSVGLNWYLNPAVSMQFAYRNVSVDRTSPGGTAFGAGVGATPALGTDVGQDLNIYSVRTQYAF